MQPLLASFVGAAIPVAVFLFKAGSESASLKLRVDDLRLLVSELEKKVDSLHADKIALAVMERDIENLKTGYQELKRRISTQSLQAVRPRLGSRPTLNEDDDE